MIWNPRLGAFRLSELISRWRWRAGDDSEENLITLCSACRASVHESKKTFVFWK
jgi:hypothetical protein